MRKQQVCNKCGQMFNADPWEDDVNICKECLEKTPSSIKCGKSLGNAETIIRVGDLNKFYDSPG